MAYVLKAGLTKHEDQIVPEVMIGLKSVVIIYNLKHTGSLAEETGT